MRRLDTTAGLCGMLSLLLACTTQLAAQPVPTATDSLYTAVDGWVQRGLVRYQIAGAAVAIVREGRIVHAAGFGFADIHAGYRVNADTTQFHIASVTKLLTAVAALQQVEAGTLALHRDVRSMLGPIHAAGWTADSVTLHDLLTHSAGLDTRWIGMATDAPTQVQALRTYMPRSMAPIINRPGDVIRYSNMGYVAVGRLVEVASGLSWPQYIEQRVLEPLGMLRSYAQPRLPSKAHATPYRYRSDTLAEPNVYEHAAPSGAVHATATDVARLLIALLDSTSAVPLTAASKTLILAPQHRPGRSVPGFGYGTFEYPNPFVHAMSVGGEVPGFSTRVLMIPSLQLGVVLMVNRKDPLLAIGVFDSLLKHVATKRDSVARCGTPRTKTTARSIDMSGQYRSNVYDRGSFLRIGALVGPLFKVVRDTGQSLIVVNPTDNSVDRWYAVGDSAWTGPLGACLELVPTSNGSMLAVSTKIAGPVMLERVTWSSNPAVVLSVVAVAGLVLFGLFVMDLPRLWSTRSVTLAPLERRAARIAASISALHWLFLSLFGIGLYDLAIGYDDRFAFGIPVWYSLTLMLPYLVAALTMGLAYLLARDAGSRYAGRRWLTVLSSGVLLAVFWNWQMFWVP